MRAVVAAADSAAGAQGAPLKLHVTEAARPFIPSARFDEVVGILRAEGSVAEAAAEPIDVDALGTEWEWETSPELSLHVVDDVDDAVALCNRLSPRFIASLISDDLAEQDAFWADVDAPFVGDGFTRWVDGQYALSTPELGLSNWEGGRLLGRGGVLAGDSVVTVRSRMTQRDPDLHR
jgi:glutamate-5-semialdehyde dehydrogenase